MYRDDLNFDSRIMFIDDRANVHVEIYYFTDILSASRSIDRLSTIESCVLAKLIKLATKREENM